MTITTPARTRPSLGLLALLLAISGPVISSALGVAAGIAIEANHPFAGGHGLSVSFLLVQFALLLVAGTASSILAARAITVSRSRTAIAALAVTGLSLIAWLTPVTIALTTF